MKDKRQKKDKIWLNTIAIKSKCSLGTPKRYWIIYSISFFVFLMLSQWFYHPTLPLKGETKLVKKEQLIRSRVSGRIAGKFVSNHQYLKKNQLILQVDCIKIDRKMQAQDSQILQYKKQINQLRRLSGFKKKETSSIKKVALNTQLQVLEGKIQELTQSNQQLQVEKQQYLCTAPIAGILNWLKPIAKVDQIHSGEVIANISAQDSLVSIYKVNRKQLNQLRLDKKVSIRTLNGKPENLIHYGLISAIEPLQEGSTYLITCNYLGPYQSLKFREQVIGYFPTKSRFPFLFDKGD